MAGPGSPGIYSIELVDKKNTKSPIWAHLGFKPNGNGTPKDLDTPVCKKCFTEVITRNGNTSNLRTHLRLKHPDIYKNLPSVESSPRQQLRVLPHSGTQTRIEESFDRGKPISRDSREHKELTRSITECLVKDMLPIYTVDKPGFRAMIRRFNSRYKLPSRSFFSREAIPSLYCEVKDKVQKDLASARYFSATTDL